MRMGVQSIKRLAALALLAVPMGMALPAAAEEHHSTHVATPAAEPVEASHTPTKPIAAAKEAPGEPAKEPVKEAPKEAAGIAADDALRMLAEGNGRFTSQASERGHQDTARRTDTATNGQHPYAALLSCADSRVPVELLFDAGIGDLFVTRVAGNVANVDEVASLEYGVERLGIHLIVVLGHSRCGAVMAVVKQEKVSPNIEKLTAGIGQSAAFAKKMYPQLSGQRLVEKAIRANVNRSVSDILARSEILRTQVQSGKLKIVGAVYDLASGEVDWLEPAMSVGSASTAEATEKQSSLLKETEPAHNEIAAHEEKGEASKSEAESMRGEKQDSHHESAGHAEAGEGEEKADTEKPGDEKHGHASAHPTTAPAQASKKPVKENFMAFAGLVGGSSAASCGLFYMMRARTKA